MIDLQDPPPAKLIKIYINTFTTDCEIEKKIIKKEIKSLLLRNELMEVPLSIFCRQVF